jgi:hypothetical protein
MRIVSIAFVLTLVVPSVASAQLVVNDPAVTLQNVLTAIVKEYTLQTQRMQHQQVRQMARRLSAFTSLTKYRLPDPPRWRTHDFENPEAFLFARPYHAALNYGDSGGSAFGGVSQPVVDASDLLARLSPQARRLVGARLATLDVAAAAAIAGTNDTGRLRFNGRRELQAIEALEADVTNGSDEQSTAAVLAKVSAASLVGARQRQARLQLLAGIVEQLLVDTKRARDADAQAMNLQLSTWRGEQAANVAFVSGSGDALRMWRQP